MKPLLIIAIFTLVGCHPTPNPEVVKAIAATCEKQQMVAQLDYNGSVRCLSPNK